ncbi:MAG: hypothetical protein R6W70_02745, partial [bacterium]
MNFFVFICFAAAFFSFSCDKKNELSSDEIDSFPGKTIPFEKSVSDLESIPEGYREVPLWLRYPVISPDGKEIVFNYKGKIWRVSSSGGTAVPLTSGKHYDFNPVWSPDGSKIAFASDRTGNFDVFVISSKGGAVKRLTWHSADDSPEAFLDNETVLFSSARKDPSESTMFPGRAFPELYKTGINEDGFEMVLHIPSHSVSIGENEKILYYHDRKGYENNWRKHHKSSVTRDIWRYDMERDVFKKLTSFSGEDREPFFHKGRVYFLSEREGSSNIWIMDEKGDGATQLTYYKDHPVRSLSITEDGVLCFSYNGEIYTMHKDGKPEKTEIFLPSENISAHEEHFVNKDPVSEFTVSSSGEEIVFVMHGEIYAVSPESGTTKRVTETPQEERWVSFTDDGKAIVYASERNSSWNIYKSEIADNAEKFFYATSFREKTLVENRHDTYQPVISPDGRFVVYMRNRKELVLYDVFQKTKKVVLPAGSFLTYTDGDVNYFFSPDSRLLAVETFRNSRWVGEISVVNVTSGKVVNVTNSGHDNSMPRWSNYGKSLAFLSTQDREKQIYGFFLNREVFNEFNMSEELFRIKHKKNSDNGDENEKSGEKKIKPVYFDDNNTEKRIKELVPETHEYLDFVFSEDDEKIYALTMSETAYNIYKTEIRKKQESLLVSIPHPPDLKWFWKPPFHIELASDGRKLFALVDNNLYEVDIEAKNYKKITYQAELTIDRYLERRYLFENVCNTISGRFYEERMHGVNWEKYCDEYSRFLPHINNNYDFTEMLSEMLGELNVSHTGSGFLGTSGPGDETGHAGMLFNSEYKGKGLQVSEILNNSPLMKADTSVSAGYIVIEVNGVRVSSERDYIREMNRTVGKYTGITFRSYDDGKTHKVRLIPVGYREFYSLMYERWIEKNRKKV